MIYNTIHFLDIRLILFFCMYLQDYIACALRMVHASQINVNCHLTEKNILVLNLPATCLHGFPMPLWVSSGCSIASMGFLWVLIHVCVCVCRTTKSNNISNYTLHFSPISLSKGKRLLIFALKFLKATFHTDI